MASKTTEKPGDFTELDAFIESLPSKNGALITVLHKTQTLYGYLSRNAMLHIADRLELPSSKVYGVATFYSYFSTEKKGRNKISVCMGTACFVRGAEAVAKEFGKELSVDISGTTEDGLFTLETLRCVGACGLAPVVTVNDKVYGRVKPEEVKSIVEEYLV